MYIKNTFNLQNSTYEYNLREAIRDKRKIQKIRK